MELCLELARLFSCGSSKCSDALVPFDLLDLVELVDLSDLADEGRSGSKNTNTLCHHCITIQEYYYIVLHKSIK